MSQLLKLADGCHVDPDLIAEIKANYDARTITVRMRDGIGHSISCDYGVSIFDTERRLVKEINDARTK